VAQTVAKAYKSRSPPANASGSSKKPTQDLEAYQLYLKGATSVNRSPKMDEKGLAYLQQAMARPQLRASPIWGLATH